MPNMEDLNPLTPNTAAFLDSITFEQVDQKNPNPSFPVSAFFPMPGRDTPEESSPSSAGGKANGDVSRSYSISDDSENELNSVNDAVQQNKRKAANEGVEDHDDMEDDDDSHSDNAHEDKRQHPNEPKAGRGPRRSSGNKDDAKKSGTGEKGGKDNMTKAQRRKEQNRAAQKAFRERREAKVRDLEEKVAELEAKSFGANVENDNLRGILRRLQEENVALKQASFTFSMPIKGNAQNGNAAPNPATNTTSTHVSGQETPTQLNQASNLDWSQFQNFAVPAQVAKPPSPPQSVSNDSLRSINENSPPLLHRSSTSSASNNSPDSLVSIGNEQSPNGMPSLFNNGNMAGNLNRSNSTSSPSLSTPSSIGTSKDDVDALFRSLYPNGIDAVLANAANATNAPMAPQQNMQTPFTFLNSQPGLTSMADSTSNALAKLFGDATSYRDPNLGNTSNVSSNPLSPSNGANGALANQTQWADLTDNSVNDFLASLTGGGSADADTTADDEAFSRQLEALIAQSGGAASAPFAFPTNNAFSPTNYLNMSPSPLNSVSNSTPQSTNDTSSPLSDAPASSTSASSPPAASCGVSQIINVVGEDGRVMRPSEVWMKMGMPNTSDPQDFLIDDLCDQMRHKATCKDGQRYMKYDDIKYLVKAREKEGSWDSETGRVPALPKKEAQSGADPTKSYHDPAECQAKLNEAYLQAATGSA